MKNKLKNSFLKIGLEFGVKPGKELSLAERIGGN